MRQRRAVIIVPVIRNVSDDRDVACLPFNGTIAAPEISQREWVREMPVETSNATGQRLSTFKPGNGAIFDLADSELPFPLPDRVNAT